MKLHLGCGERYLEGYINIDYPPEEHTVQSKNVADVQCDLRKLHYEKGTVEEIRLHHVFEHFSRPVACALITKWSEWLYRGGRLHIEVPDFDRTCMHIFNPFTGDKARKIGLRHLFGSQEADWAVHYVGYGKKEICDLMKLNGFEIKKISRNHWKDTYNIEVIAEKKRELDLEIKAAGTREYLKKYCVDESAGELKMLDVWVNMYEEQLYE